MDTSETYIKMRLAAIRDLGRGRMSLQPYHFVQGTPDFSNQVVIDRKGDWYHLTVNGTLVGICQLERQDQLQEMVSNSFWECCNKMNNYVCGLRYPLGLGSMEQLWLAFVMSERFSKVWSNGEWYEEGDSPHTE